MGASSFASNLAACAAPPCTTPPYQIRCVGVGMSNDTDTFFCYGCGNDALDCKTKVAMVCTCGGHGGVCLDCWNTTQGKWALLRYKPSDWQRHSMHHTGITPAVEEAGRRRIEGMLTAVLGPPAPPPPPLLKQLEEFRTPFIVLIALVVFLFVKSLI